MHEIDHPSNTSMNRTVEQLTENSEERTELLKELIGLIFREVKCIVFRDMQQTSHNHSMFFIIICLYITIQLSWERLRKACGLFGAKK